MNNKKVTRYRNLNEIDKDIKFLKNTCNEDDFLKDDEIYIREEIDHQAEAPDEYLKFQKDNHERVFNLYKGKELEQLSISDFMEISEYKLLDYFKYFDKDGSDGLDLQEMRAMGAHMGISNKMMDIMFKEIDTDQGGSVSSQEWVDYVLKSRNQKNEIRNHDNILLDIYDKHQSAQSGDKTENNFSAVNRKFNLNIFDSYKINEYELDDAIKIGKKKVSEMGSYGKADYKEFYDLQDNNYDSTNLKNNNKNVDYNLQVCEEEKIESNNKYNKTRNYIKNKLQVLKYHKRNSKSEKLDASDFLLEPSELAKIKQSKSFKLNKFDEDDESIDLDNMDLNELDDYFNSSTTTNISKIKHNKTKDLEDSIFLSGNTNTDNKNKNHKIVYKENEQKNKQVKRKPNKNLDIIDEAIENEKVLFDNKRLINRDFEYNHYKNDSSQNSFSYDRGTRDKILNPALNQSPLISREQYKMQNNSTVNQKYNKKFSNSIKYKRENGVFSNLAQKMFSNY